MAYSSSFRIATENDSRDVFAVLFWEHHKPLAMDGCHGKRLPYPVIVLAWEWWR